MHQITNKVDFYITNVCNLTCKDCNRFNNYDFKGWQKWSDYADTYAKWSKKVQLKAITIMGGEPFLNPTLPDWVQGLNQLFGVEVQILTNGTRFRFAQDLYQTLLPEVNGLKNHIGVSLHNRNDFEMIDADIRSFLQGTIDVAPKENNLWNSDWHYRDSNGVVVNMYLVNEFGPSAIRTDYRGRRTLHNTDPVLAHTNCPFAQYKSYHFIRGALYKCGPVALLPEFDKQHPFVLADYNRELLNSYQPLTVDNFDTYHKDFFDNIDKPIPQCKFCPSQYETKTIFPIRKGLL